MDKEEKEEKEEKKEKGPRRRRISSPPHSESTTD